MFWQICHLPPFVSHDIYLQLFGSSATLPGLRKKAATSVFLNIFGSLVVEMIFVKRLAMFFLCHMMFRDFKVDTVCSCCLAGFRCHQLEGRGALLVECFLCRLLHSGMLLCITRCVRVLPVPPLTQRDVVMYYTLC